jgi:t-SNARE complex subunit (syntaxin)
MTEHFRNKKNQFMESHDDSDDFEKGELSPLVTNIRVNKREEARNAGIQRIQRDMNTVNQLFRDLSGLVIHQGDSVTAVDASVERSITHAENAKEEVEKTDKRHKQQQKFLLRIIIILVVAILVIFLIRRML